MSFESQLRPDLAKGDLFKEQPKVKVIAEKWFGDIIHSSLQPIQTPGAAKNITEVMELIQQAFDDYYKRTQVNEDAKVSFLYEDPDKDALLEAVTVSLIKREPGMFGQGSPFENKTKQLRPVLRHISDDEDNPGYKRAVLGYWYDNLLRLTCWARTNKTANERALWLENLMEEYTWFFGFSGVNRILYQGRQEERMLIIDNNKVYGRPVDYFVRTEKLRSVSQKILEQIIVRLHVKTT